MELLIIRHGQSEADLLGVHEGRADFPLTGLGEQQAKRMTTYVAAQFPPDVILTSPLKRAKVTALLLQGEVGCQLIEERDLMEFNNGVLAGLSREEAAVKYPLPPNGRPPHIPIENGESELEFRFRAERIFQKIINHYRDYNRVAVVSHGGLISQFLRAYLQQPISSQHFFATGDTGIHLLEIKEDKRVIRFLNKLEHLSVE
ncbi:histidine phosphatase family protein [Psychrobacillus lasiicapitis]|uniref:Histidine phosphatase family protein n=1 Tax=Psychrobacillus lasiicapitis TaxID=1636719 RepID=A0A544T6W9_9BACI|nr:histidine phosphatase family protein [Psychrobacillus lasiicapitis]TQR13192.1 histidine phosphatase family protein [Psychrobacillus lasiicapitis]GGA33676.1 phosphoglycerate mutase [Psychrobacillus lasiicapitis]